MKRLQKFHFFSGILFLILILVSLSYGQQTQVDQSRQFRVDATPRYQADAETESDLTDSPITPGDSDLGDQLLLFEKPAYNPFVIRASFTLLHTNNVFLTDNSTGEDRLAIYEAFVGYNPKLTNRLIANLGYQHQFYHYQKRGQLNFDSQTLSAGLSTPIPELWNILLYANYSYNRLTYAKGNGDGDALTEFYRSHAATAGIYKTISLSRAHYFYLGPSGKWALTDPFVVARDEYSMLFGYHADITRWFSADISHVTSFHDYKSGDRDDINQTIGGVLTLSPWKWLDISMISSYGSNNSTNEALNYEYFNIGGQVKASYQF